MAPGIPVVLLGGLKVFRTLGLSLTIHVDTMTQSSCKGKKITAEEAKTNKEMSLL